MTEIWLPIPGFEQYSVSDRGRVRSEPRDHIDIRGGKRHCDGRVLSQHPNSQGYPHVNLHPRGRWRETTRYKVHRLVLSAFVGPCPEGMEVLHYDDDPSNNRLENLRYGTRTENIYDAFRNGNRKLKTHCSRGGHELTPDNVYQYGNQRCCKTCQKDTSRRPMVTSICQICGSEFTRRYQRPGGPKTCSYDCKSEQSRRTRLAAASINEFERL